MTEPRPYNERPPARPIMPPENPTALTPGSGLPPSKKAFSARTGVLLTLIAAGAIGIIVAANLLISPAPTASQSCKGAFDVATAEIATLYETHPFFGDEYDNLYMDGLTDVEAARVEELRLDEEAQYNAIVEPTYFACEGVEDFYLGAYTQEDQYNWGLEGNEAISTEELKDTFISSYCATRVETPACSDYDPS